MRSRSEGGIILVAWKPSLWHFSLTVCTESTELQFKMIWIPTMRVSAFHVLIQQSTTNDRKWWHRHSRMKLATWDFPMLFDHARNRKAQRFHSSVVARDDGCDPTRSWSKYHTDTTRTKAQGTSRTNVVGVSATLDARCRRGPTQTRSGTAVIQFQSTVIIIMSQISATSRRVVQNLAHRKVDW